MKIEVRRQGSGFKLVGTNEQGNQVVMDNPFTGKAQEGASPMELLLMAIAGCSAIDIIAILEKQKLDLTEFRIEVDADRIPNQSPSFFKDINIKYFVKGDFDGARLEAAAAISLKKYCTVAKIMEKTSSITFSTYLNENLVPKKNAPVSEAS